MKIRKAVTAVMILGLASATLATAQGRAGGKVARRAQEAGPVLEATFENGGSADRLIVPTDGWPLTLTLTAKEERILGLESGIFPFPGSGQRGELVFSSAEAGPTSGAAGSGSAGSWERRGGSVSSPIRLGFEPGWNLPTAGGKPADGGQPRLWTVGFGENLELVRELALVGPQLGSSKDGYGYGANPLLPGLVLLADSGPGVVTDENFERPSPRRARNLAGFFHSLAYELRDASGRTSLTAHMNVPRGLLSPVVLADTELAKPCGMEPEPLETTSGARAVQRSSLIAEAQRGGLGSSEEKASDAARPRPPAQGPGQRPSVEAEQRGDTIVRIDGGPRKCRALRSRPFFDPLPARVTIRAFVVDGKAPAELADLDGNGVVDSKDARRAGLRLLSDQAAVSVMVHFQGYSVLDLPNHFYFDFDGNGRVGSPPGTEPGAAQLTDPPR